MTLFVNKYRHFFKSNSENITNYSRRNKNKLILPTTKLKTQGPYKLMVKIFNKIPSS